MMLPVSDNKPLQIPNNKSWKGVTVYCYKCIRNVSDICGETGKPIKSCKYGDKHIFKAYTYVPGTKKRKTKNLGRNWVKAVQEAIEFEKEVKSSVVEQEDLRINIVDVKKQEPLQKPATVKGAMARYIGYLNNDPEIVPSFRKKVRSKGHISDVKRCFKRALYSWKKSGYDINNLLLGEVDEMVFEKFHTFMIEELKLSNRSYNKNLGILTSFYDYLNTREKYNISNPFSSIDRKPTQTNVDTITKEEYEKLLEIIQRKELGKHILKTGAVKWYYKKKWMGEAVELGLLSGRRNEEVARMMFSDIFENPYGVLEYIKIFDLKVNRQTGRVGQNAKEIYVPVTADLRDLIMRLDYEKHKGTDKYLIGTNETMSREALTRFMSQSFTHYFKQLGTGRDLTYKCLRKTYISQLSAMIGIENARLISKHSGTAVMEQHYIDKRVMSQTAQSFNVFGKEKQEEKERELKEIRDKNKQVEKGKSITE